MRTILIVILTYLSILQQLHAQSSWTYQDRMNYAQNAADSSLWDMEMFKDDVDFFHENSWTTKMAISDYPSPVPAYDWGYGYISNLQLVIDNDTIQGSSIGFAKDSYRMDQLKDTTDYYVNYFNIFIWTDLTEAESGAKGIVSRNYPHYLSSGKEKTSQGVVDWLQMSVADGSNFAVVAQRYFDLEFGRTILVVPLQDGSLRILQIKEDVGSLSWDDRGKSRLKEYEQRLENNVKVKKFFGRENRL